MRNAERTYGDSVIGFKDGWRGVIEGDFINLDVEAMRGTLPRGGTVLGTTRVQPFGVKNGVKKALSTIKEQKVDALIVIGGDGTLSSALDFYEETQLPLVGVPKTIDNDIAGTDITFGFMTAVQTATDAIDRLHTTAESHDRIIVVEVMGRSAGHIAVWAGMAGGATLTLIPEEPFDIQKISNALKMRHKSNRFASLIVAAEGARPIPGQLQLPEVEEDEFGHTALGGIGKIVAEEIQKNTGLTTRSLALGYIQRGGTPNAFDRVLCSQFGIAAVEALHQEDFGSMVAFKNGRVTRVTLEKSGPRLVEKDLMKAAKVFFTPGLD